MHTDDFFIPASRRGRSRPSLGEYYDTVRLRGDALGPLIGGDQALYRFFDWNAGSIGAGTRSVAPTDLIVVEGVYSAAPELADLVDRSIYVDTPEAKRLRRLRRLIAPADWDEGWLRAETEYFARVRPPASFDLVLNGTELRLTEGCDPRDTTRATGNRSSAERRPPTGRD